MKWLFLLLFPTVAWSCPKGSVEWQGTCVADLKPVEGNTMNPAWVSNEKPPRNPQAAWETGATKAAMTPAQDEKTEVDDQIHYAQARDRRNVH